MLASLGLTGLTGVRRSVGRVRRFAERMQGLRGRALHAVGGFAPQAMHAMQPLRKRPLPSKEKTYSSKRRTLVRPLQAC